MDETVSRAVTEGNVHDIEDLVTSALAAGKNPRDLLEAITAGMLAELGG